MVKLVLVCVVATVVLPARVWSADDPPKIRIVVVGDSTVIDGSERLGKWGWGGQLSQFFTDRVTIFNHAVGGRSSSSFIREGRWTRALEDKPDWVFVQFGHNDCPGKGDRETDPKTTYREFLTRYVTDARKAGAKVVLVTPMTRRRFNKDGTVRTILGPYAEGMKAVGRKMKVPVVDLHAKSIAHLERDGEDAAKLLNPPKHPTDLTHFSKEGAVLMARFIVEELPEAAPELKPYLKDLPKE